VLTFGIRGAEPAAARPYGAAETPEVRGWFHSRRKVFGGRWGLLTRQDWGFLWKPPAA